MRRSKRRLKRLCKCRAESGYYKNGPGSIGWRLKTLGHKTYRNYLASDHWQTVRDSYLATNGQLCGAGCGRIGQHLHHKTYERLGREELTDLILLCASCHENVHQREHSAIRGGLAVALRRLINRNSKISHPTGQKSKSVTKVDCPLAGSC